VAETADLKSYTPASNLYYYDLLRLSPTKSDGRPPSLSAGSPALSERKAWAHPFLPAGIDMGLLLHHN